MQKAVSTFIYIKERLHPGLLDGLARSGAQAIEIFAARQHLDYANRKQHVREIADWFRTSGVPLHSVHAPLYGDYEWGRAGSPPVNIAAADRAGRVEAMDEIKRALEAAEHIPFRHMVIHLGEQYDGWSQRTLEYAETALEHLGAFARPLGVRLLVENLLSEPTTPEHLTTILEMGHLDSVGVCLDLGHAHITLGTAEAFSVLGSRIVSMHVHDNHGLKDEHLWPGDGSIAWPAVAEALKSLAAPPAAVLEISEKLGDAPAAFPERIRASFDRLA